MVNTTLLRTSRCTIAAMMVVSEKSPIQDSERCAGRSDAYEYGRGLDPTATLAYLIDDPVQHVR